MWSGLEKLVKCEKLVIRQYVFLLSAIFQFVLQLYDSMTHLYKFSSLVSVRDFKEKITSTIDYEDTRREHNALDRSSILSEMDITQETLAELEDVCSPSNLKCENEPSDDTTIKSASFPEADLAVLNLVSDKSGQSSDLKPKLFIPNQKNYITLSERLEIAKADEKEKIDGLEVVLSVALYHPDKLTKVQEFLVLGRQTMTELRDKIYCPADSIVVGEHSENPEFTTVTTAKDICPSGFIFIEGVFYNDMRKGLCRDYSKSITEWTNKKHNGEIPRYGLCTTKSMEETKFEDLKIKLGYPYVYTHQGNCEHLLIFRDLRMLHADDLQDVSNYPFQVFRPRPKRQRCVVCSIYSARWLTRNDLLMSEDPSLFCEKCFTSLHYKKNQKAYTFSAYQYSGNYYW